MPVLQAVYTIGHSTRALGEFLALLEENQIRLLVDVRRFPQSRRHPHFSQRALAEALAAAAVEYRHEPDLGGHREPRPDSPHTAWRNAAFRGYADHMESTAFRAALERLTDRVAQTRLAVMCAEADPWRCHRQLIADALVARGIEVRHILAPRDARPHALNPAARVGLHAAIVYDRAERQERFFQRD